MQYTSEAQFTFHHINAYEDGGFLVLDMAAYKDATLIDRLYMKNFTEETIKESLGREGSMFGEVRRFVFPLEVDDQVCIQNCSK